jgi:hypothetical protein
MAQSAISKTLIENERVVVTEWSFPNKGDSTGWHRHGLDYVVVPLRDGALKIVSAGGETIAPMKAGAPYFRQAGVEHDVINWTDGPYAFLEIEIK